MSSLKNKKELYEKLESNNIPKEVLKIFIELDNTESVSTQADLNEMLVELWKRLGKSSNINIESIGERATQDELERWIKENIGGYSQDMFFNTINK